MVSKGKLETSKVVTPTKTNESTIDSSIEALKELMLMEVEIVSVPRKTEIDEKTLKTSRDVARLFKQSLNWDKILEKYGKKEYLVTLEQVYKAYSEPMVTSKNAERTKINTPIYVSLSKEMHKLGMSITQGGKKGRMKLTDKEGKPVMKNGKQAEKDVYVVKITPLELKEYQEVNLDGNVVTKSGWIVDSLGKSMMKEDMENNNLTFLSLEFYRPEGKEDSDNFSVIVEKGSTEEEKYIQADKEARAEAEKTTEVADEV